MNNKITLLSMVALMVAWSCSDEFLDKPLQNQLTQESFPETADDAIAATNAIYATLRDGLYHRGFFPIDDIMSDDAVKGSNPGDGIGNVQPFDVYEYNVTNDLVANWWRALYQGVRRANVVIQNVPGMDIDPELRDRLVGEARFLRALFYFDLARAYGGVPIITTTNPEPRQTRASLEEVYDLINSDLRVAINSLPPKNEYPVSEIGRATQGAAQALLGRAYLYQEQFDSAAYYSLEVINSGLYDLFPEYGTAFSIEGEFGIESVFEAGGIGEVENFESGNNVYAQSQGVRGVPNRGFGFNRPTPDLMESYEAGDTRLDETVIFLGEMLDSILIGGDGQTPDSYTGPHGQTILETYNEKVWTPGTTVAASFEHNRRLIRYAEVLLNAAEALNETGTGDPLIYLNKVRARARPADDDTVLPDITTTDQEELRRIILEERRHELALEGFRFWDVVRMGLGPEIFGPLGFEEDQHENLPIPQTEIDISQGSLTQNPGWQ